MYLLLLGVALLAMKTLAYGPIAAWNWWLVLSPFALAVLWWAWADWSGYTKKKEMDKMDKRKAKRIDKQRDAMGMLKKRR